MPEKAAMVSCMLPVVRPCLCHTPHMPCHIALPPCLLRWAALRCHAVIWPGMEMISLYNATTGAHIYAGRVCTSTKQRCGMTQAPDGTLHPALCDSYGRAVNVTGLKVRPCMWCTGNAVDVDPVSGGFTRCGAGTGIQTLHCMHCSTYLPVHTPCIDRQQIDACAHSSPPLSSPLLCAVTICVPISGVCCCPLRDAQTSAIPAWLRGRPDAVSSRLRAQMSQ